MNGHTIKIVNNRGEHSGKGHHFGYEVAAGCFYKNDIPLKEIEI